ncbi:helix-turn-helix domain-containing protein [Corynebacterium sp. MSK218]|uniref:helix-turn-helix domain-containing protein n=1 Tax=Corynebacterium sp. MSK218 TaxID=3050218 RepID=UPI0025509936|nr:helix-turn-helix domain-containing protein [Corynebacterium sp. MSK218]MDK8763502.1 helix-turn-helix domain-containing protein [Corynebacterium sp. MSK218]
MHEERWREIVAEVHSDIPRLVEDFLTAFTAAGRYGDSLVSEDELRLTAFEVFARITEVLVGAMDKSELRTHAQNLGRRRARQGVELASLIDAIQLDFDVLWARLREAAGADQSTLIEHVAHLHSVVTLYNLMVRDAYRVEEARGQHDVRLAHARHLERLLAADDLDPLGVTEIARALDVVADTHFHVVIAHPTAAVELRALLDAPIASGTAFGHGTRGMFVAFWPAGTPAGPTVNRDELAAIPGVRFPTVKGLAGVRAAARQAPRLFAAAGTLPHLVDVSDLLWAVAGDAIAGFEGSPITQATEAIATLRSTNPPVYDTLTTYLDTGSIKDTAEALHCHRNTVINRLHHVTTATGLDVTQPKGAALVLLCLFRAAPPATAD